MLSAFLQVLKALEACGLVISRMGTVFGGFGVVEESLGDSVVRTAAFHLDDVFAFLPEESLHFHDFGDHFDFAFEDAFF